MNGFGKIRRCTDRNAAIIDFHLCLAALIVTIRQLIARARTLYRWDSAGEHRCLNATASRAQYSCTACSAATALWWVADT
ncbi:hypothetical protein GCM10010112_13310 [Actinoplanes lobatus]|nr:hypothetical protein GCM10010112_13310 [Actinoplanes lobatus]